MREIILGIDPGSSLMGFGVIEVEGDSVRFIAAGHHNFRSIRPFIPRLRLIFENTLVWIDKYKPGVLAIESQFYEKNIQTTLKLGKAQGVAIAAAQYRGLEVFEYSPRKIKLSVTGNGNASKRQVTAMLANHLHGGDIPSQPDACDALAAALCHCFQRNNLSGVGKFSGWKQYMAANPGKVI